MVSGVVLAAGGSRRLGRPKQLLPLAGEPVLAHVVRSALASGLAEVVTVLGHEADAIAAAVGDRGQRTVVNPDWAAGQSTSLRAGLAAIDPAADAVLFLLGDQPGVGCETIDAVLAAARDDPEARPIAAAEYGGRLGNPVLFRRALFPDLAALIGDEGARRLLRADPGRVLRVPVGDGPPPPDIDTEDDYRALVAAWSS